MSLTNCVWGATVISRIVFKVFTKARNPRAFFLGRKNMEKERRWSIEEGGELSGGMREALLRVLQQPCGDGGGLRIDRVAEALVAAAEEGVLGAIKEINERVDGKVSSASSALRGGGVVLVVDTGIGLSGSGDDAAD